MICSIGIILLGGFLIGVLFQKMKIPSLVGMILFGICIGPYCLNSIDGGLLGISAELRQIALVIILTRSGLNLDFKSLKKIGTSAILLCFVPATFEIVGVFLAGYYLLHLSVFESLLLGSVLGAVSPAIVSPRMIRLIEDGYAKEHETPKLILAGSSVDDIYVVVLFYSFLGLVQNNTFDARGIAMIPVSIVLGIGLGGLVGYLVALLFKKLNTNTIVSILITLSLSFLFIGLENLLKPWVSISALLAIIVMSMMILLKSEKKAEELSKGYNGLWKFFEIFLFVLVGASMDVSFALKNGLLALAVLCIGLVFRMVGVIISVLCSKLTWKERLYVGISYIPKATVQASIGGIALSLGLSCGAIVLTVSVVAILITAPLGAILMDSLKNKLLPKPVPVESVCQLSLVEK